MSRKASMIVLLAALGLAVAPALAAPLQKSQIHPTATWVAHIDLEAFRGSGIGRMVMAELQKQDIGRQAESFETLFSFNPLNDLHNVTLYGKGADRDNAVIIIGGKLDTEKLLSFVRLSPQYQEAQYKGATIHRWHQEHHQMMSGYIDSSNRIVIGFGLEAVQQAVDALKGQATGTPTNLLTQIPEGRGRVFAQVAATGVGEIAGQNPQAAMLKQADSLALAVGEATEKVFAELNLLGQSADVAENINKTLQGIVAMVQLMANEQPQLADLAKNLHVSRADKTVQIRFEAATQSVFGFLKTQWEKQN
jgi:hypothetical protein